MLKSMATIAAATAFWFAPAALAQTPAPAAQPEQTATPEELAAARANADEIIRKAGASDLFDNITTKGFAEIRHKQSGLVCGFDPDSKVARINIYPGLPRGDDVSCTSSKADLLDSVYATRFKPTPTLDEAFALYQREIFAVRADVKPYEGKVATISMERQTTATKTGYYTFTDKDGSVIGERGGKVVSRLAVAVTDGWVFEQRVSGPFDKAMMVSFMGEISMLAMLDKIREGKTASAPVSPPVAEPQPAVKPEDSPPSL